MCDIQLYLPLPLAEGIASFDFWEISLQWVFSYISGLILFILMICVFCLYTSLLCIPLYTSCTKMLKILCIKDHIEIQRNTIYDVTMLWIDKINFIKPLNYPIKVVNFRWKWESPGNKLLDIGQTDKEILYFITRKNVGKKKPYNSERL